MKILKFFSDNILFLLTLFLLAFIPLYPKLPLIDIKNTWVNVRAEDFIILIALCIWFFQIARGKVTLKTPLTLSIFIFWLVGTLVTLHAVIIIFPTLSNVFPNVAFLSVLRRIEYISLFFIAFSSIREKTPLNYIIGILVGTLLLISGYGFAQKYLQFPAFLTMNEEYAKGIPIILSRDSRVPSTFGGHYDLAAYLVLILPIIISLIFGFKNWVVKLILGISAISGVVLLFMTISRVSFFVLGVALFFLILFYGKRNVFQKKTLYVFLAVIALGILAFFSSNLPKKLLARFGNTVSEVDILVDAKTGVDIGPVKKVSTKVFQKKLILGQDFGDKYALDQRIDDIHQSALASSAAIIPFAYVGTEGYLVVPPDTPTGENLPQGTGYVNLTLSPVSKRLADFFYEIPISPKNPTLTGYVTRYHGQFLIKRAIAYDLSFTTRFQGEWPHTLDAFKRNILFGSGYSSVSLAVDNNFLRILGETGILGFASFFAIFLLVGIYIKKTLPQVESPVAKSFVLGVAAGIIGLTLNAALIDVFEASKVAYTLWLLVGITIGILHQYQKKQFSLLAEFKNVLVSQYAYILYICITSFTIFSSLVNNYFVGDDFTWFRWAGDCNLFNRSGICPNAFGKIAYYFTHSDGFFYRPAGKVYFLFMYSVFWLNQNMYHVVSLLLHTGNAVLLFLLTRKILKNNFFAFLTAVLFLILSGYLETVFWVAATEHLFCSLLMLLSLLFYIRWDEKRKVVSLILSFICFSVSMLFYELGVVTPLLIIAYKFVTDHSFTIKKLATDTIFRLFTIPIVIYLFARYFAQSHWFSGDYNYNLVKLPLNIVGNVFGYALLDLAGSTSLTIYEALRNNLKHFTLIGLVVIAFAIIAIGVMYQLKIYKKMHLSKFFKKNIDENNKKILLWGCLLFIIPLLPYLGFGNISSRFSYLSSAGFILLVIFCIRKIYDLLLKNGKDVAIVGVTLIVSLFSLFQIIQIQKTYSDWWEAGERVRKFFVTIDGLYEDNWSTDPMEFYFVNVPKRVGDAYVFNLGLQDALWIVFRNPKMKIFEGLSLNQALDSVQDSRIQKVFEFDENGNLSQVKRIQSVKGIMIERLR